MILARGRRPTAGFSLIELLIVIAIILIILTVAVPRLNTAVRGAREMAAMKAVTTIHTAQTQYYSNFNRYATSLLELGPPASGGATGPSAAELIERDLASGEKGGYKYTVTGSPTGYVVNALPSNYPTSGSRTYFSDQSMTIHVHNGPEPATANDLLMGESQQQQQAK